MFTDVAGGCVFGYARFGCKRGWRPVGFPDSTVRESRDRWRTAIRNAGLAIPVAPITVSLACRPAEGEDFASRDPGMSGSTS